MTFGGGPQRNLKGVAASAVFSPFDLLKWVRAGVTRCQAGLAWMTKAR
jgi:hypothetical protein